MLYFTHVSQLPLILQLNSLLPCQMSLLFTPIKKFPSPHLARGYLWYEGRKRDIWLMCADYYSQFFMMQVMHAFEHAPKVYESCWYNTTYLSYVNSLGYIKMLDHSKCFVYNIYFFSFFIIYIFFSSFT